MTLWITALFVLSNFSLGAMLPLLPALSPDGAGWSFTAFNLVKALFFLPAGRVSDGLGHPRALTLTLFLQVAALLLIAFAPEQPWYGRVVEGMALAQGTVTNVSLLRIASPSPAEFEALMRRVLGIGSIGFLLGPVIGYPIAARDPHSLILLLVGLNAGALVLQIARMQSVSRRVCERAVDTARPHGTSRTVYVWAIVGLAAAKVLGVGWQPNLAWWNTHEMAMSPALAALSFLVMGVAYGLGATLQTRVPVGVVAIAGALGYGLLEIALRAVPGTWWVALVLLGFWFGGYLTRAVVTLGWNDPDALGRANSVWLVFTDLPMAIAPALLWHWRAPEPGLFRTALGAVLLLVATAGAIHVRTRGGT